MATRSPLRINRKFSARACREFIAATPQKSPLQRGEKSRHSGRPQRCVRGELAGCGLCDRSARMPRCPALALCGRGEKLQWRAWDVCRIYRENLRNIRRIPLVLSKGLQNKFGRNRSGKSLGMWSSHEKSVAHTLRWRDTDESQNRGGDAQLGELLPLFWGYCVRKQIERNFGCCPCRAAVPMV